MVIRKIKVAVGEDSVNKFEIQRIIIYIYKYFMQPFYIYLRLKLNYCHMKKIIYFYIIICITSFYTSGQSIVDTTKKWNTLIAGPPYNPMPEQHTEIIIFQQDTIIDAKTYKKVFRSTDEFMTNWEVYCYIRETVDNKVYMRSDTSAQEYLLYDMGASLNDTLLVTGIESYMGSWSFISNYLVITSIDSVLIGNTYRKRINFQDTVGTQGEWINGIGSIYGILHNSIGVVGGDWFQLLCYSENDTIKYQDSTANSCFIESTNFENNNSYAISIKLYPNPANSNLSIEITNDQLQITSLTILNITGQQVKSIKTKGQSKNYNVSVENFPAGIYFLKVQTNDGTVVKKFVKQ